MCHAGVGLWNSACLCSGRDFQFQCSPLVYSSGEFYRCFIAACRSRLGALGAPCQLQLQTTGTRLGTKRILIAELWVPLQEQRRAFQPSGWVHSKGRGWAVKRYTQQVIQADRGTRPLNSSVIFLGVNMTTRKTIKSSRSNYKLVEVIELDEVGGVKGIYFEVVDPAGSVLGTYGSLGDANKAFKSFSPCSQDNSYEP